MWNAIRMVVGSSLALAKDFSLWGGCFSPSGPGLIKKKLRGIIIDVADFNQEESGQWLENVDRTHLILASGKPVLQKILFESPMNWYWYYFTGLSSLCSVSFYV